MSEPKSFIVLYGGKFIRAYEESEADKVIAELKDKCQMHDFFWEGCGFAKRGFKNTIAVSEAYDFMEAENVRLKEAIAVYQRNEKLDIWEIRHSKYKRCLAMAKWCENAILGWMGSKESFSSHQRYVKVMLFTKWQNRWLKIAEQFKEAQ